MELIIVLPPVLIVDCADAQISSMLSMKAASSIIRRERASERAASLAADTAFICEPFLKRSESLLSSITDVFSHDGRLSYMTLAFVTRFLAVSCFVAMIRIF